MTTGSARAAAGAPRPKSRAPRPVARVAMVRGAKRYILSPPTSCKSLNLIPERKHPSFRHSITDWSDPDQARNAFDRPDARSVDTVVREGEVLYVPSYWIHYIVSLQYSAQSLGFGS